MSKKLGIDDVEPKFGTWKRGVGISWREWEMFRPYLELEVSRVNDHSQNYENDT